MVNRKNKELFALIDKLHEHKEQLEPKSFSKKKTEMAERGEIVPVTKPDADNYLKAIKDALNGVIWRDDSQIVDVQVSKRYSVRPRIEIEVHEVF